MGRGVSVPCDATVVCYKDLTDYEHDEDEHPLGFLDYDWPDFCNWIVEQATKAWPSMRPADKWVGRENHVLCENRHGMIGVSEYCGRAAIWLVPHEDSGWFYPDDTLHEPWCRQVEGTFRRIFADPTDPQTIVKLGTMSNGCGVFRRPAAEGAAA